MLGQSFEDRELPKDRDLSRSQEDRLEPGWQAKNRKSGSSLDDKLKDRKSGSNLDGRLKNMKSDSNLDGRLNLDNRLKIGDLQARTWIAG